MVKGHVAPTFAAHGALPRGQSAHTHLATMPTEHHATTRFLGDPANVTRARFRLYQPNLSRVLRRATDGPARLLTPTRCIKGHAGPPRSERGSDSPDGKRRVNLASTPMD